MPSWPSEIMRKINLTSIKHNHKPQIPRKPSPAFGWGKRGLPYAPALPLTGWNKSQLNGLISTLGLCCFCPRGKFQFPCRDKGSCEPWRQRPWMAAVFSARATHVPQNNWCLWLLQAAAAHWTSTKGLYHLWEKTLKRNIIFSLKSTFFCFIFSPKIHLFCFILTRRSNFQQPPPKPRRVSEWKAVWKWV